MILLNFTTALKYIIGLMLVMLGWIPYEKLDQDNGITHKPELDTVFYENPIGSREFNSTLFDNSFSMENNQYPIALYISKYPFFKSPEETEIILFNESNGIQSEVRILLN